MLHLRNISPTSLSPVYPAGFVGDFDPVAALKGAIIDPVLNSALRPQNPVRPEDEQGKLVDENTIQNFILAALDEDVNPDAENLTRTFYHQGLVHYHPGPEFLSQELFLNQAAIKEGIPAPKPNLIYTPARDIIPQAKKALSGQASPDLFFAGLGIYARPKCLGIYFANAEVFHEFKLWVDQERQAYDPLMSVSSKQLFTSFQSLDLQGLTESIVIRGDDNQNNEPYSFARMLLHFIMAYTQVENPQHYGLLPFTLDELFLPKSLVFVNLEQHAQAYPNAIAQEWQTINRAIYNRPKVLSNKEIAQLTSAQRTLQKLRKNAKYIRKKSQDDLVKAKNIKFSKQEPKTIDIAKRLRRILDRMISRNQTQNVVKYQKSSFQKANRRRPDDYNAPGKILSQQYKPDIHLYLDTSGSVSESEYQDGVMSCIKLAQTLDVNLYFNSFSHRMSQSTLLRTKGLSAKEAYKAFQRVPKVSGGTDYVQIWNYITRSTKRPTELSIIMTDFEWTAPTKYYRHPKNLYYIPLSGRDWDYLTQEATHFVNSMQHIDPKVRAKLLF